MKVSSKKIFKSNSLIILLTAFLLVSVALSLASFVHVSTWDAYDRQYLLRAQEQKALSQQVAKYALAAASGDEKAFVRLREVRVRFEQVMQELRSGSKQDKMLAAPPAVDPQMVAVEAAWAKLRMNTDHVLKGKDSILIVREYVNVITETIPRLQKLADDVVMGLIAQEASPKQVYIASNQLMLAQRIGNNASQVLAGGDAATTAIEQFSQDVDRFGSIIAGMRKGDTRLDIESVQDPAIAKKLVKLSQLFVPVEDHAEGIIDATPNLLPVLVAAGTVLIDSENASAASADLVDAFKQSPGRLRIGQYKIGSLAPVVIGSVGVVFLVLIGYVLLTGARQREWISQRQNEKNQQAILRLLDEMGDLADGDLTVTATVTEDITGAIADSINYAIEALRDLVLTINSTADKVSSSAQESRATAMHLAEASEHQAEQISSATGAIDGMTQAIDDMSKNAIESAQVAQRAVDIATKGTETVHSTIKGMDTIREHIQETSKRIKRLGESSQEIGDIVELIEDIADQTNILALNAAMQAAMAGEAGRGFAVVADEVQRLAERSGNATKQIEALVRTIQADTNEAVSSMEASTTGVVAGANLAEDAGEALKEIESVSNYIAEITGNIAQSAQAQSSAATSINDTMNVIQEITNQTTDGSAQAASSIGQLADTADELQRSVSGFRLPE
ncbi:twitching motility protein PilJ [hydrothermal vent metagenome]|uniref:Twitching motility protein PilJ n=1 Tax=hydrothermal vent metagenome TaxID=652676 RepID=A0A3B1B4R5_9ZZZZ